MIGYLAPEGLEHLLKAELQQIRYTLGRLFVTDEPQPAYWAQNTWFNAEIIPFTSIRDAAKKLRARGPLWALYSHTHVRRAALIQEQLPAFKPKPLLFPQLPPQAPLGSWTLLDPNTLIAASHCASPVLNGEYHFVESKEPPSRAYLKLYEALTRLGHCPKPNELCLELGASPGGWTWVLSRLGARVIAVDRAPLARLYPNTRLLQQDAFQIDPAQYKHVDWVFSDLICYPEKLLAWLNKWIEQKIPAQFVCTIKFQEGQDYSILSEFRKLPNSQIFHLYHNKHELTLTCKN